MCNNLFCTKPYVVSLFGHRKTNEHRQIEKSITEIVTKLSEENPNIDFWIGRNGEFDVYCASLIKGLKKEQDLQGVKLNLVIPYPLADINYYEDYYDSVIYPHCLYHVHPKRAITERNRFMIDHSDLVTIYVNEKHGGAYNAMRYAEYTGKRVINIAEE